jgi:phosphatidylglycerol:prolipoprotein diacylglycerol transferase
LGSAAISFPIFGESFVIDPPRYITVFGFNVYLYGLFVTSGFILAALYLYKRRETLELTRDNVLDLVIMAVPCGLLGARIFYIIFNASDYFGPGKWQNMFALREGGLAVYGGVIGGAIAFYVYSRVKKVPVGKLWDAAGFGLLIGQATGRWGNFFNREAYGTETDLPWRMGLTAGARTIYVHPAFLYEMLWNAAGLILLHVFSGKYKRKYYGQYFLFYVAWYGFGRFMIEGIRIDSLFIQGTDIRISQLLAALSFSTAVVILLRSHLRGYTSKEVLETQNSEINKDGGEKDA